MEHCFLFYIFDGKTGQINLDEMILVGKFNLDNTVEDDEYFEKLQEELNSRLRPFLEEQNIIKFIPLKNPSIEINDDFVSVCYYHNKKAYDIIFSNYPKYIMMPNAQIEHDLNQLYYNHGLHDGWYDYRCNTYSEMDDAEED